MPRETPSPIDLPAPPLAAAGLGWTATALAVAAAVLLVLNAVSLRDWVEELAPGPWQARAAAAAEGWLALTERLGLAAPRAALHDRWKRAEQARFGGATSD